MTYKSEFLNILSERGFLHQCSDYEALDAKLMSGVQSAYIGFDATARSLHIGNLTGIMMLKWFQECGHKPITLMGGGTSKVGDPSFKSETRKMLTDEDINDNIENIRATCFKQFLNYGDGKTDAKMVNNDDWLSSLHYLSFLRDYGRYFSVNKMVSYEFIRSRFENESFVSLLEFNYMVMQGYDFLELHRREGTILQMGGSDQWGNIINGVDLAHKSDKVQLYALTAPLLLNSAGEKMGKTVGGAVWLNKNMLSAYDYWQYFRNVDDADVGNLLARFTMLPMDEVKRLSSLQGSEINEAKKILAHHATMLCHGEQAALDAAATAQKVFEQGGIGGDLPAFTAFATNGDTKIPLVDVFVGTKLSSSKGEARRLIEGGGARFNDEPVGDVTASLLAKDWAGKGPQKVSSGKKKHAMLEIAVDAAKADGGFAIHPA
ncbi:MAG: tyrosine--tRNA ligase [Micavibrio aeruginosavorus]|uniref:Tyrosine--tRNA ligase n=1 Tax=Micavibrio aeruginosavorus TaxID=349221 RepID=A0A2W5MZZ6_9BACT|nr:MAG: tyrosine--tRNA ligase [Micavibrio aeruginosavorus]